MCWALKAFGGVLDLGVKLHNLAVSPIKALAPKPEPEPVMSPEVARRVSRIHGMISGLLPSFDPAEIKPWIERALFNVMLDDEIDGYLVEMASDGPDLSVTVTVRLSIVPDEIPVTFSLTPAGS